MHCNTYSSHCLCGLGSKRLLHGQLCPHGRPITRQHELPTQGTNLNITYTTNSDSVIYYNVNIIEKSLISVWK